MDTCPVCGLTADQTDSPGCYSPFAGMYWTHCCMNPYCECDEGVE